MKENFFKIASITVIFMLFIFSCSEKLPDDLVQRAYELRMDGKADAAQVLLEQAIKKDSADAAAWFELARTKLNIGLGDPHKLIAGLDDMQHTINKAVEIDSNNVIYLFFKGYVCYTRIYATYQGLSKIQVEKVAKETVSTFESVLRLEPNYYEAKLFLVELLKMLPSNVGGDSAKAEKYTQDLEKADVVFGAKARELVMPRDADYIKFWQNIEKNHQDNADVYEALGRAYLQKKEIEQAAKCFDKAIQLNAEKNTLYVDLGRYYMMQFMQNRANLDSLAPLIIKEFETFLKSKPAPIKPVKAYVIGMLAKIYLFQGNKEKGDELQKEAMALDPNFSKAFAIPGQILFDPPDKISRFFSYFSRPF